MTQPESFWEARIDELLARLGSTPEGLSTLQARPFVAHPVERASEESPVRLLLRQFGSPLVLLLLFSAGLSFALGERVDATIILTIVAVSGLLGYRQERGAMDVVRRLLAIVTVRTTVLRDGREVALTVDEVVPGDIVSLEAGGIIPGDCRLLETTDLYVDESALTGETFPVAKSPGLLSGATPLAERTNSVFMGTHVVSGRGRAVVVTTGDETEFGGISGRLRSRVPESEFEHGVRRFGYLLMEITLLLVITIFAVNVYLARPVVDSFLFSLALAVGLTPQLLPAIVSINLARGAHRMADARVIVKRLAAIQNFGSMNILCSDKTGTLTEGVVRLESAVDVSGTEREKVLLYAYLNAVHERGFANPIDEAIRTRSQFDISPHPKLDEVPYDFIRKRLSILVADGEGSVMITKGALQNVLAICSCAETGEGKTVGIDEVRDRVASLLEDFSRRGFRTLGIACKTMAGNARITKESETDMTFLGLLALHDPLKSGIGETIKRLRTLGVSLKIVTGDNHLVAAYVADRLGLDPSRILTGPEIRTVSDSALVRRARSAQIFAEIEPNQKERIILALRKSGNVVGYIGDGINDAPAIHAADVGISVDGGVDVAREAAEIVLLENDLGVLVDGVLEGRRTFANTLKYVFMATSANFGNMFSMAGASLFLPFLPLLPKQILLTNLLTDLPEMTIAGDEVDDELLRRPHRWDLRFIRRFMATFGLLSSVFDYITFGVLLLILNAGETEFRTGWFVESVASAALIVLVIRTRRPIFRSRPGRYLRLSTLLVVCCALAVPFTPLAGVFGFVRLPATFLAALGVILLLYVGSAEVAKKLFYRHIHVSTRPGTDGGVRRPAQQHDR